MSRKHLSVIGVGLGSLLLAGALATAINLGILRAAGVPSGPGRLGALDLPSMAIEASEAGPSPAPGEPAAVAGDGRGPASRGSGRPVPSTSPSGLDAGPMPPGSQDDHTNGPGADD